MFLKRVNLAAVMLALLLFSPFANTGDAVQPAVELGNLQIPVHTKGDYRKCRGHRPLDQQRDTAISQCLVRTVWRSGARVYFPGDLPPPVR